MKTSHKVIVILAITLILVVGLYVAGRQKNQTQNSVPPVSQTETTNLTIVPLVSEKDNHKDTYKSYVMDNTYPQSSATTLPEVFTFVQNAKASFLDDYNSISDKDAQFMDLAERPYNFTITTTVATSSKTVTYIVDVYQFEGGAHGGTSVNTFTYDAKGKLVTLDQVFAQPYLSVVAPLARQYFYTKLGTDAQAQMIDDGTEATTTNFSEWYLTDQTVTFIFGQYQVGPYVIGIQEFPIDKSQIQDILSPEFR